MTNSPPVISVRDVVVEFGGTTVLDRASVDVFEGEILGFVGGSGAGKSVLMRAIIGLVPKQQGTIEVFGHDLAALSDQQRRAVEQRWAVLFQQGALLSSLNGAAKRAIPDPRISQAVAASDGRDRAGQTGDGRLERRRARQISRRAIRWHDQAGGSGARAGARSRHCFPR